MNDTRIDFGWLRDPEAVAGVLATLPRPLFAEAGIATITEPGDAFLWEAAKRVTGEQLPAHDQDGVGCCVGEGFSSAVEYLQCVEIALGGAAAEYCAISCEVVYALSRVEVGGGRISGDGSTGAWAAKAVNAYGVLPRRVFGGYDL